MQNIAFKIIKVILIVGALLGTTNAFANQKEPSELLSQSIKNTVKAGGKTSEVVSFLDGQFSTIKPASWSIRQDLHDYADLQMGNLSKGAYCIVMSESKIDYDDNYTLDDYSKLTSNFIIENIPQPSVSAENLVINGNSAIRTEIIGSVDGIKIRYWHISIDTKSHFHQLVLWSVPSYFEANRADYEAVLNSFDYNF